MLPAPSGATISKRPTILLPRVSDTVLGNTCDAWFGTHARERALGESGRAGKRGDSTIFRAAFCAPDAPRTTVYTIARDRSRAMGDTCTVRHTRVRRVAAVEECAVSTCGPAARHERRMTR